MSSASRRKVRREGFLVLFVCGFLAVMSGCALNPDVEALFHPTGSVTLDDAGACISQTFIVLAVDEGATVSWAVGDAGDAGVETCVREDDAGGYLCSLPEGECGKP